MTQDLARLVNAFAANPAALGKIPSDKLNILRVALGPKWTPFIPSRPTPKQAMFLSPMMDGFKEAFYGGAAGGGKSEALLMAALQYVDVPGYSALILRRTYADLAKPGAIMDRAIQWLVSQDGVKWNGTEKRFSFPSGATLTFGYLKSENDKLQYQSSEYQFIGFDELTHFSETQYTYLFSRLRRKRSIPAPLRVRSASNPGGPGHQWVKQRFIVEGRSHKRPFIPAYLQDNPFLNQGEYLDSLSYLDPTTRTQLLKGDWDAELGGGMFKREWFKSVRRADVPDRHELELLRFWDMAATEPTDDYPDPDWTVGVLQGYHKPTQMIYVLDVVRVRLSPGAVKEVVKATAARDGRRAKIRMEREGGSGGKNTIFMYRGELGGYDFKGVPPLGSKTARAALVANHAYDGLYAVVEDEWTSDWLVEMCEFPLATTHDDQVDATSGGFMELFPAHRKHERRPAVTSGLYTR